MRYTEYHNGIAVIKDKALLKDAMKKLAKYEDTESRLELICKITKHCGCIEDCDECVIDSICDVDSFARWDLEHLEKASKMIDALNER